jgi:diguanylate cyclase (GGDEF)-like protein
MPKQKLIFSFRIFLIVLQVSLITFVSHMLKQHWPYEIGRYISVDVFYCLPVIQTARLASLHVMRHSDTQVSTLIGIALSLAWSLTEAALFWPFPPEALLLNIFTRAVVFTVMGRVIGKLLREREYAHKDPLTALANRTEFLKRLRIEQERSERTRSPYTVLFIDVDNFKSLNDTMGHRVGDEALKLIAEVLRASTRTIDVTARLGGDEFVVLLPDTDAHGCEIVVERIEIASQKLFGENYWPISVSTGRTTWVGRTEKPDWVIHLADENMYEVKNAKKGSATVIADEA